MNQQEHVHGTSEETFVVPQVGKDENENIIHDFHRINMTGDQVISVSRKVKIDFLNISPGLGIKEGLQDGRFQHPPSAKMSWKVHGADWARIQRHRCPVSSENRRQSGE